MRQDERRPLRALDNTRHGKRLARAGHAEEGLLFESTLKAVDEFVDGLRLVAGGFEGRMEFEWGHGG